MAGETPLLSKEVLKDIDRISRQYGIDAAQIRKEVIDIMNQGYSDEAALTIWKSQNKFRLRGTVAEVIARIIAVTKPERIETRDGNQFDIARVYAFLGYQGVIDLYQAALYDDRIALADNLEPGKAYKFKARLFEATGDRLPSFRFVDENIQEVSDSDFPLLDELIEQYGVQHLSKIENLAGMTCFFRGRVGRVFSFQGGKGFEISELGSTPVSVFSRDEDLQVKLGQLVIVLGEVVQREDEAIIRARAVIPLGD